MKRVDDQWSWIEGLTNGKWMPLYCFRARDEERLQTIFGYIKRERAEGRKLRDGLDEYANFRIHHAGTYMESVISIEDIRQNIDTENLARILSKFNQTECGVVREKTGQRCRLPLFHEGKHSPKRKEDA